MIGSFYDAAFSTGKVENTGRKEAEIREDKMIANEAFPSAILLIMYIMLNNISKRPRALYKIFLSHLIQAQGVSPLSQFEGALAKQRRTAFVNL